MAKSGGQKDKPNKCNIKFFGIGYPRTGTSSLLEAMKQLGFRTKRNPANLDEVAKVHYAADVTVAYRYKYFDFLFPDVKFIMPVRNLDRWLRSCEWKMNTRQHAYPIRPGKYEWIFNRGKDPTKLAKVEGFFNLFECTYYDEELFTKNFIRHNKEVKEYFKDRPDKLLIIRICEGEGWKELCHFVKKPIPSGAFPHVNKGRYAK